MKLPFENDTSKVVKRLAKRSLQADKRRNFFVVITIILTTALLSGIFFVTFAGQRKLEADIRGQYQAVVVDTTQKEINNLSSRSEIEQWGLSQKYGMSRYQDSNLIEADANWMVLGNGRMLLLYCRHLAHYPRAWWLFGGRIGGRHGEF